jgi:hypothetical protein
MITLPQTRKDFLIPKSVVGNDGGTEPKGGAPFRFSLTRIPLTVEGRADHFSEVCPVSGLENPRANYCTAHTYKQANLNSQNLLTIASLALLRQPEHAGDRSVSGGAVSLDALKRPGKNNPALIFGRVSVDPQALKQLQRSERSPAFVFPLNPATKPSLNRSVGVPAFLLRRSFTCKKSRFSRSTEIASVGFFKAKTGCGNRNTPGGAS